MGTTSESARPESTRLRIALKECSPCKFSLANSPCISETDLPLDDFMKPKKALKVAESSLEAALAWNISVPAPHRLMARGALAGSEPKRTWTISALRAPEERPVRT